jgi:ABC-type phosphate transport system substrate-binding protein
MTMDDPRFTDPRLSDPVIRRDEDAAPMYGWVAGLALLLVIGFIFFAGWKNNSNTASSRSTPPTAASRTMTPPSTTGSGSSLPQPITPAPSKSGTQ